MCFKNYCIFYLSNLKKYLYQCHKSSIGPISLSKYLLLQL